MYAGSTLLGCLLEVLAPLRPDPVVAAALEDVVEEDADATDHPTATAGTLSPEWLARRRASRAELSGTYCCVTQAESVATLREHFVVLATVQLDLPDFDAAALRAARPRELTQRVSSWLWEQSLDDDRPIDGVRFQPRHGDEHDLWAVFERDEDAAVSRRITDPEPVDLTEHPALVEAMRLHNLHWA